MALIKREILTGGWGRGRGRTQKTGSNSRAVAWGGEKAAEPGDMALMPPFHDTRLVKCLHVDQTTNSPPFFLRDSRASETRALVKITPREKSRHVERFSRALAFRSPLLSSRKNGGLLVVYIISNVILNIIEWKYDNRHTQHCFPKQSAITRCHLTISSPVSDMEVQSNPGNTDTEGAIESVGIKRVELRENVLKGFLSPGTKQLTC